MKHVEAEWSGKYPCLCFGEWTLKIDREDCSKLITKKLRVHSDMNTFGKYDKWHFENWQVVWETYEDGLKDTEWIEENNHWLKNFQLKRCSMVMSSKHSMKKTGDIKVVEDAYDTHKRCRP